MFGACSSIKGGPMYSHVRAYISEDYSDKFDAMEFILEDFGLKNAKDFTGFFNHYGYWDNNDRYIRDENTRVGRYFLIELKKKGKRRVHQARKHLGKLEFIEKTEYYTSTDPGILLQLRGLARLNIAYANHWFSQDDLRDIAYYHNESIGILDENYTPTPKNPEVLDTETRDKIHDARYSNDYYDLKYYGTYNDCVAVNFSFDTYVNHNASPYKIGGVDFYGYSVNSIYIWKEKNE